VNEEHAAAVIEGDEIFRSRIAGFQKIGILGEKVAESKADICYINESVVGLSSSWYQDCKLNYVAGYTALLSREETFTRLKGLHEEDSTFPKLSQFMRKGCRYSAIVSYVPAGSIPKGNDCRIPDLFGGIRPRIDGVPRSSKFDYTFDPDAIDQSVDLLWINHTQRYYQESLWCVPEMLCFNSPRSTPIQAD
jgi:hypothetical protein